MGFYESSMEYEYSMTEENVDRHGTLYGVSVYTNEDDYNY